jgi:hypothetical protein
MSSKRPTELTPWQCRMARAGLRWSVLDLTDKARVGKTTVIRFENEQATTNQSTRAIMRHAFEQAGVRFDGQYGVHMPETMKEMGGKE